MSVRQVFAKLYQFENYPHFNTERMRQSSMVVSVILSFGWGALKINSLTLILDFNQLLLFTQLRYYLHFFARGRQLKYLSIDLSNINSRHVVEELCHFAIRCTHIIVELLFVVEVLRRTWYTSNLNFYLFQRIAS